MSLRLRTMSLRTLAKTEVSEANTRLLRRTVVSCHFEPVCNVHLTVL